MIASKAGNLYIVRHGPYLVTPGYTSGPNSTLSPEGHKLLYSLGKKIDRQLIHDNSFISRVYYSPVKRADESAHVFANALTIPLPYFSPLNDLATANEPQWDNEEETKFIAAGGNIFAPNPDRPRITGESFDGFVIRTQKVFDQILYYVMSGEHVAAITHEDVAKVGIAWMCGQGIEGIQNVTIEKANAIKLVLDAGQNVTNLEFITPDLFSKTERKY